MKGSGGVTRGYLRPGFSRSPPVLMAGLLIIAGISAFNYWNLSAQYGDLVKEIAELQDHIRIATLKRENAEKRIDAMQQRLRESEDQLGHLKITTDERTRELAEALKAKQFHSKESESLRNQLRAVSETLKNQSTLHEELVSLRSDVEKWKFQNAILTEKNSVLQLSLSDTKAQLASVISQNQPGVFKVPPIRQVGRIKTESDQKVKTTSTEKENKIAGKASMAHTSHTVKEEFEDTQDGQPDPRDKYNEIDLNLDGQDLTGNAAKVRDVPIGVDQLEEDDGVNDGVERTTLGKVNSSLMANKEKSSTTKTASNGEIGTTKLKTLLSLTGNIDTKTDQKSPPRSTDTEIGHAVTSTVSPDTLRANQNNTNKIHEEQMRPPPANEPVPIKDAAFISPARPMGALKIKDSVGVVSESVAQVKISGAEKVTTTATTTTTTDQSFDLDNHIHNQEMEHFQI